MNKLELLPVSEWRPGWSQKSKNACLKMLGMSPTLRGYFPLIFPWWNKWPVRLTGNPKPSPWLTMPEWVAEFLKNNGGK